MGGVAAAVGGDAAAAALAGKIEVENNETLGSARLYKFNSAVEASTTVCQQKPTEDRCKNALVQIAKQIKEEGCGRGHTSPTCEALIYQRDIVESTYQTWLNNPKRINNVRQGEVLGSIAMSPFAAISREVTKLVTDDTNTVDGVTVVTAAASNVGAVGVQTAAARGAVVARPNPIVDKGLENVVLPPENTYTVYPRGVGASNGAIPSNYSVVSRWMTAEEASLWVQNQGTAVPTGAGTPLPGTSTTSLYVTAPNAPKPGGTGPIRVDFAIPTSALQKAGNTDWYQIYQPVQSTPIYNVNIHVPNGTTLP